MKTLILTLLAAFSSSALADPGTPLDAVKAMIHGANERQVTAVNLEKVGMEPEELVKLFNDVDVDKATFVNWGQAWWKPEENGNFQLRMANPMCIGFEVRFVKDEKLGCKGYYEVVNIQL